MKRLLVIAAVLVLTLIAGQVWADIIATRTNTNPLFVGGGTQSCAPATFIPLNNSGSTRMPFVTTRDNQRVVVTFNAECSVKAPDFSTWLNIDILVDGIEAPPTQTIDNAFCTSHGNNTLDGWVSASTTGVFIVPEPGLHSIQVRGSLIGCSDTSDDQWRIDDSSTIIQSNF